MRWCLLLAGCLGCSSSSSGGPSSEQANPCATPGATYEETFTEQSGGTCGAVPSQVINVNANGTITLPTSITCASSSVTGCTSKGTDCTFTTQGITFTETYSTTFAPDGGTATGIATISGMGNGQSCSSTYNLTITEQ